MLGLSHHGQSWTYTNSGYQGGLAIPDRTIESNLANQPGQSVFDPAEGALEISTGPLATAPPAPLSYAPAIFNPAVQNLQFLLTTILLRSDVAHGIQPMAPSPMGDTA